MHFKTERFSINLDYLIQLGAQVWFGLVAFYSLSLYILNFAFKYARCWPPIFLMHQTQPNIFHYEVLFLNFIFNFCWWTVLCNTTKKPWFVSDFEFVDLPLILICNCICQPCANQESLRVIMPPRTQNIRFFPPLIQHPEPYRILFVSLHVPEQSRW